MEVQVITTVATGAILAMFTAILAWQGKGRFDALDRRMEAQERRFEVHDQANERRFDQLASEIAQLRSDLTHVALAVGAKQQPQTG